LLKQKRCDNFAGFVNISFTRVPAAAAEVYMSIIYHLKRMGLEPIKVLKKNLCIRIDF